MTGLGYSSGIHDISTTILGTGLKAKEKRVTIINLGQTNAGINYFYESVYFSAVEVAGMYSLNSDFVLMLKGALTPTKISCPN